MDTTRCQDLADRLHSLLLQQLGMGLDARRMLEEPLYARDVLLVCAAHPDTELARLAQEFRAAAAAPVRAATQTPADRTGPPLPARQAPHSPLSRFPRLSRFGASIFGGSLVEGTVFGARRADPQTDFGDEGFIAPAPHPPGHVGDKNRAGPPTERRRTRRLFGR